MIENINMFVKITCDKCGFKQTELLPESNDKFFAAGWGLNKGRKYTHLCGKCLGKRSPVKASGFPQETDYSWWPQPKVNNDMSVSSVGWEVRHNIYQHRTYGSKATIAAPTLNELGAILYRVEEVDMMSAYGHAFNVPDTKVITAAGLQICMSDPNVAARMYLYLAKKGFPKGE